MLGQDISFLFNSFTMTFGLNKKTKKEALSDAGILGIVRLKFGAIDEYDITKDEAINAASAHEILCRYCAYKTGTAFLWAHFKEIFDNLSE